MQTIASKARSVWRLLLSRTSFCAAFLCLSLIRFVDNTLYWNVLRYLMFPWGAALAYPLLTLHNLPRNRGMVFAFAFFIWYFIVSYVNRKHSFYQNAYDWFLILFSLFIFYPQDRSLPFASLKLRMQVVLGSFYGLWAVYCLIALFAAFKGQTFTCMSGSVFGMHDNRIWIAGNPNTVGYLCAAGLLFSLYFAIEKKRSLTVPLVINGMLLFVCLSLSDSRSSIIMLCLCVFLLLFTVLQAHKMPKRVLIAIFGSLLLFISFRLVGAGILRIIANAPHVASRSIGYKASSLNGRTALWTGALLFLRDHPFSLFTGITRIGIWEALGVYASGIYQAGSLHNTYLQTLLAAGLPGLACMAGLGCVVAPRAWRLLFPAKGNAPSSSCILAAVLALFIGISFVEDLLFMTNNVSNQLFFYTAGCVMCLSDNQGV